MKHPVHCGSKKKIRAEQEKDRKDKQKQQGGKIITEGTYVAETDLEMLRLLNKLDEKVEQAKALGFDPSRLSFNK